MHVNTVHHLTVQDAMIDYLDPSHTEGEDGWAELYSIKDSIEGWLTYWGKK